MNMGRSHHYGSDMVPWKILVATLMTLLTVAPAAPCPTGCTGCGTSSLKCSITQPQQSILAYESPAQVTQLEITCSGSGTISTLSGIENYPHLQDLAINQCRLSVVDYEAFILLPNLTKLNLSTNGIYSVRNSAFKGLAALEVLDVSHNDLTALPIFGQLSRLHTLILDYNLISKLNGASLQELNLVENFSITNNLISGIGDKALTKLTSAVDINLSGNKLEYVSASDLPQESLERLDLSDNSIQSVDSGVFGMPKLKHLDLAGNKIEKLDRLSFGLVEYLDLASNKISAVSEMFVQDLKKSQIKTILLTDNPLHCNCYLEAFRQYFMSNFQMFNNGTAASYPACYTPAILSFAKLFSQDVAFNCTAPFISLTTSSSGEDVICESQGDPVPKVTWLDDNTGETLVMSQQPQEPLKTTNTAILVQKHIEANSLYTCHAESAFSAASRSFLALPAAKQTAVSNANSEDSVSFRTFIGSIVGTFFITLMLIVFILICLKFCRCNKKGQKSKQNPRAQRSKVYRDNIRATVHDWYPGYGSPKTHKPYEPPPDYPPQSYRGHPQYHEQPVQEDEVYAEIPASTINNNDFDPPPRQTPYIEELPDTPSTSTTQLNTNSSSQTPLSKTPSSSSNNLPSSSSDPTVHIEYIQYQKEIPIPSQPVIINYPSVSSASIDPRIFAQNRRVSERVRLRSNSGGRPRGSILVVGDTHGDPSFSFPGVYMARSSSLDYGHEVEV